VEKYGRSGETTDGNVTVRMRIAYWRGCVVCAPIKELISTFVSRNQ